MKIPNIDINEVIEQAYCDAVYYKKHFDYNRKSLIVLTSVWCKIGIYLNYFDCYGVRQSEIIKDLRFKHKPSMVGTDIHFTYESQEQYEQSDLYNYIATLTKGVDYVDLKELE